MIPGKTIEKDPKITIAANSEAAYVRIFVKINTNFLDVLDSSKGFPTVIKADWILANTTVSGGYTTLEYRYNGVVRKAAKDTVLPILFDNVTVLSTATTAQLSAIVDPTIQVVAQLVQSQGFSDSDKAFTTVGNPSDFQTGKED